jgi:hypothetical protein
MDIQEIKHSNIQSSSDSIPAAIAERILGFTSDDKSENIYLLDLLKIKQILKP